MPVAELARRTDLEIGYDSSTKGFDGSSCGVQVCIGNQSVDIAQGVDDAWEERSTGSVDPLDRQGAGDQGLMFGYACDDTPELMPLPITIAHRLAERLSAVRKDGTMAYLRPTARPRSRSSTTATARSASTPSWSPASTPATSTSSRCSRRTSRSTSSTRCSARFDIDSSDYRLLVNPTGRFEVGGPMGDAGLTGRKIIIDTYGGMARHGGGAFSGKDPSKVDRSGAYAMRWVAKNVVAAGLARRCEVQVAYAIGKAHPVGFYVDCFGTEIGPGRRHPHRGARRSSTCGRRRSSATSTCSGRSTRSTAAYGHFGRELPEFTWERTRPGRRAEGGRPQPERRCRRSDGRRLPATTDAS